MEKMIWEKPEMNEVAFAANEYVAACGDSGKVYKFVCDALAGPLYIFGTWVEGRYWDTFKGLEVTSSTRPDFSEYETDLLGNSYTPCKKTHEADATDDFFWGFVDYNDNDAYDAPASAEDNTVDETVIVWRGESGWNGHATKQLNIDKWETAKS